MGSDVKVQTTMQQTLFTDHSEIAQPSILACLYNGPKACFSQFTLPT